MNDNQKIILCPQHSWAYPSNRDDIFTTGTVGDIVQALHMPDGAIHAIIRTTNVVEISDITMKDGLFYADATPIKMLDDSEFDQTIALRDKVADALQSLSNRHKIKTEKLNAVIQNYPMSAFVDAVVQMTNIDTDVAVEILKMKNLARKIDGFVGTNYVAD